ncbi:MAG TPA: hypothetical protein VHB02_06000 [Acidimicrobiales bacterium]|nr:hypothetical protein [Acidimicrobiales bacterium]
MLQLVLGDVTLDLRDPDLGLVVQTVDIGAATPREVVTDLPGQDGSDDQTQYFATRVVSITGVAGPGTAGSRSKVLDLLAPFLGLSVPRPQLIYALDEDVDPRYLTLRVGQWTAPAGPGAASAFAVQWKCADPIAYGLALNEVSLPPLTADAPGWSYPRTYPRSYPVLATGHGSIFAINNGTYPSWPMFRLFGPCGGTQLAIHWLDPTGIENLQTQVVIAGLTLAAGTYLEITSKARTAVLNGDPDANRYSYVDFGQTTWGPLLPGTNRLRFTASSATTPSICQILWRDAYL